MSIVTAATRKWHMGISMLTVVVLFAMGMGVTAVSAQENQSPVTNHAEVTGFGFNWATDNLDKEQCLPMTPKLVSSFKSCVHVGKNDSQSGAVKFQCEASSGESYLISDTLKQCREQKDNIAANAP